MKPIKVTYFWKAYGQDRFSIKCQILLLFRLYLCNENTYSKTKHTVL